MIIGCDKPNLDSEKIDLKDTIGTGNKLSNLIVNTSPFMGDVHISVGWKFLDKAKSGILDELTKNKKNFLDSYLLTDNTLDFLIKNKPFKSQGIKLTFVEINSGDYDNILNIPKKDSVLYPLASYITESGELDSDNHHFIFNLKNKFDINNKIMDREFVKLRDAYKGNIHKVCTTYYSHNGKGNTNSIFYTWGDIIDIVQKNNRDVNFKLAEIISYDDIKKIVNGDPYLKPSEPEYRASYSGREKQLTMLGEYKSKGSYVFSVYFDMGTLYP